LEPGQIWAKFGTLDLSVPMLHPKNAAVFTVICDYQIPGLYGTTLRSTPAFFLTDDHDMFENDEFRSGIGKAIAAGAPGGLHPWEITMAEMLGDAGYRTAMFGKWHVGAGAGRLPTDQGFDEWFGFETTDIVYWNGKPGMPLKDVDYIREARKGEKPRNVQVYDEDTRRQIDRLLTDRAVDYITKNGKGDRPFFLYVPLAFAHHPALAHPDFKGKSPAGEFGDSLLEHDHNAFSTPSRLPASPTTQWSFGRATTARRRLPLSHRGGQTETAVRGAARSVQSWKETFALLVSFAGLAKFLPRALATRSFR
jgi:hypothetical protein